MSLSDELLDVFEGKVRKVGFEKRVFLIFESVMAHNVSYVTLM